MKVPRVATDSWDQRCVLVPTHCFLVSSRPMNTNRASSSSWPSTRSAGWKHRQVESNVVAIDASVVVVVADIERETQRQREREKVLSPFVFISSCCFADCGCFANRGVIVRYRNFMNCMSDRSTNSPRHISFTFLVLCFSFLILCLST